MVGQNTPFRICTASSRNSSGVLSCLGAAFECYRKVYTPRAFADTVLDAQTIKRRLERMHVFVAISRREVIGTVGCEVNGTEGHLRGMAVLPEWRGADVASALLRAAEDQLRKEGCSYVTLDTTQPLQRALRFYEKHGFSPSGKTSDYFGMSLHQYSKSL